MDGKVARVLASPVMIQYRSSEAIWPQKGEVCLDERGTSVQIFLVDEANPGSGEGFEIKLTDIERCLPKDYIDYGISMYCLHLLETSGKSTSLEFEKKDVRDTWSGLSGLLKSDYEFSGHMEEVRYPVTEVKVLEPKHYMTLTMELRVNGQMVQFNLPEIKTTTEEWKDHVAHFVKEHKILLTERNSLYRFVKACASRVQAAKEVAMFVNNIDNLYVDRVMEQVGVATANSTQQSTEAQEKLMQMEHKIERNGMWHQGIGPVMTANILRRNIEKTKMINDLTSHARNQAQQHQGTARSGGSGGAPRSGGR